MNKKTFWDYFAYGYFLVNTFGLLVILETIFLGKPWGSMFLLVFALVLSFHLPRTHKK